MDKFKSFFANIYYYTIGRVVREIQYRRRIKKMRERDPFIY